MERQGRCNREEVVFDGALEAEQLFLGLERIPRWGTSMSQAWRWGSTGSGEQRTEELKLEREVGVMSEGPRVLRERLRLISR